MEVDIQTALIRSEGNHVHVVYGSARIRGVPAHSREGGTKRLAPGLPTVAIHVQPLTSRPMCTYVSPVPTLVAVTPGLPRATVEVLPLSTTTALRTFDWNADAGSPPSVLAFAALLAFVAFVALVAIAALGTVPSVESFIFAPVTASFLIFFVVTAPFFSCLLPTLLFGIFNAA